MKNELPERINSLLMDLNSNSAPKILTAIEKLEEIGIADYRVVYAIRKYSESASTPLLNYKALRLADKLENQVAESLNRPTSQLTDRELMEKIALEQLSQQKRQKEISAMLLSLAVMLLSILINVISR